MATFPTGIDSFSNPQGTTNLSTDDHANQHRVSGSAIIAVENKVGIGSGSASVNALLVGSGLGTSAWGTTLATVSVNNSTLGTPRITGGTASAFLLGTSTIQGGTANALNLGTPVITGGVSLSANGSITQTSTADHITLTAGGTKVVKATTVTATGTAGTTVAYITGFPQYGWFDMVMAGGGTSALGTTTFPLTYGTIYSLSPQIIGVSVGTPTLLSDYTTSVVGIGFTQAFGADSVTTSGFKVSIKTSGTAGITTHYAVGWVAYGV